MDANYLHYQFTKGYDRSVAPIRAELGSFYDLQNIRHSPTQYGRLEQTKPLRIAATRTAGTYWDGVGSATEPSTSTIWHYTNNVPGLTVTDYVIHGSGGSQIQVYYQVTYPVAETVYTGCQLVINNITGLGINLGSTLDVEMTAAAAFRWRKNGGAWTAGVPAITGVSIDGGNATLYFLAASGFAGTEAWAWRRTDASFETSANKQIGPVGYVYYRGTLYFTSVDRRVMVSKTAGATQYAISLGYRPVYGMYLEVFENHLIVGCFSKTASSFMRNLVVGWSDNLDLENFIPTDTNEADAKQLDDKTDALAESWITGLYVLGQQLNVVTLPWIYTTAYLGLPFVFSFQANIPLRTLNLYHSVIRIPFGICLIGDNNVYIVDGNGIKPIGVPLAQTFGSYHGFYNTTDDEIVLMSVSTGVLFCYQRRWGTWYKRSASFNDGYVGSLYFSGSTIYIGTKNRQILSDSQWEGNQPVMDASEGAAYATPKFTTQLIGRALGTVKEARGATYLAFYVDATGVSTTYYSTTTNVQLQLHWYLSTDGRITGTPTTDSDAVLTTASELSQFSHPRTPFRGLALEVQVVGLVSNKPPARVFITDLQTLIAGLGDDDESAER